MFSHIQPEVLYRTFHIEQFLKGACSTSVPNVTKTAKGLVFVQLYAVYEFTITETFSAAVRAISNYCIPALKIKPEILSIAYDSKWNSIQDTSRKNSWLKRINILKETRNQVPVIVQDDTFPFDGSHFRTKQLDTIWEILGISLPIISKPVHIGRIQEFIEHRNAIAHGRETAEGIGSRFTQNDLNIRIKDIQEICIYIIDTIESHCSTEKNLQMS